MEMMKGFEVYDIKTHARMLDKYSYTDDGELWKQDAHGNWSKVLERNELIVIPYNQSGELEVW